MSTAAVTVTCVHCRERIVPLVGFPSAEWAHPRAAEPPVVTCRDGEHRAEPDSAAFGTALAAEVDRMLAEESALRYWLNEVAVPEALVDAALTGTGFVRITRLESGQVVVGRVNPRDVTIIARPF